MKRETHTTGRVEQDVPIRLYRFRRRYRWGWAARLPAIPGAPEGYGATPGEALAALTEGLTGEDFAALLKLAMAAPGGER